MSVNKPFSTALGAPRTSSLLDQSVQPIIHGVLFATFWIATRCSAPSHFQRGLEAVEPFLFSVGRQCARQVRCSNACICGAVPTKRYLQTRKRRRIGLRFAGDAHIGGSDVLMGVPTTGLEYLLMALFTTGLVYMTGGMVGTGVVFMFVGGFLTDFGYITGSLLGADLVVVLMMCVS